MRDSSLSYRAAPDPGGVSVPIRTTSGVPHILGSSGVGCPKACDRRAPWPLEPHGRSLRVSPQRSEHRSQWPKAVIELENPRQAFTVPALRRVIGDVLLTGHSQIVIGLPAQTLIDNDALVALCITARHAIAHGAELRVVGADRRVRETLELCQLDGLEFFSSIKHALARPRAGVIRRVRSRWRDTLQRQPPAVTRSSSSRSPS